MKSVIFVQAMSQSSGYAKTLAAAYNPGMCLLALSVILCRISGQKNKRCKGFGDGNGEDEFFILEETKINGSAYILVAESEDDDAECLILKDVRDEESGESVYEIVENEKELQAVSKVFEELLEDVSIEL